MPKLGYRLVSGALGLTAVSGLIAIALAATPIEERQQVMKNNGEAMKALAGIAQKKAPFDAAVIQANAEQIAAGLTKAKDLFPSGSDTGEKETWAKPEIWQNKEAFNQGLERAVEAAKKVAAVEQESNFLPALGELGNSCKNCHDRFRRPKE